MCSISYFISLCFHIFYLGKQLAKVIKLDEVLLGCQPGQMVERPEDKDRDGL